MIIRKRPNAKSNHYRSAKPPSMYITEAIGSFGERIVHSLIPGSTHAGRPIDLRFYSKTNSMQEVGVEVKTSKLDNRGVLNIKQIQHYIDTFGIDAAYLAMVYYRVIAGAKVPQLIYIFPMRVAVFLINSIHSIGKNPKMAFHPLSPFNARNLYHGLDNRGIYHAREYILSGLSENPQAILRILDHKDSVAHILSLDPNFKG